MSRAVGHRDGRSRCACPGWSSVGAVHTRRRVVPRFGDRPATDRCRWRWDQPIRGIRAPGFGLPRYGALGTWRHGGRKDFVSVRYGTPGVVLELTGQPYARLVVGVADPDGVLRAARPGGRIPASPRRDRLHFPAGSAGVRRVHGALVRRVPPRRQALVGGAAAGRQRAGDHQDRRPAVVVDPAAAGARCWGSRCGRWSAWTCRSGSGTGCRSRSAWSSCRSSFALWLGFEREHAEPGWPRARSRGRAGRRERHRCRTRTPGQRIGAGRVAAASRVPRRHLGSTRRDDGGDLVDAPRR